MVAAVIALLVFSHPIAAPAQEAKKSWAEASCFDKWVRSGNRTITFFDWMERNCNDEPSAARAYEMFINQATSGNSGSGSAGGKKPKATPPCGLNSYCGNGTGDALVRLRRTDRQ